MATAREKAGKRARKRVTKKASEPAKKEDLEMLFSEGNTETVSGVVAPTVSPSESTTSKNENIVQDLLAEGEDFAGLTLRKITLADIAILQMAKSPFMSGVSVGEMENPLFEVCRFAALIEDGIDSKKALGLVKNPDKLDGRAIEIGGDIEPTDTTGLIAKIFKVLVDATETKVKPVAKEGSKKGKA